MNDYFVLHGVVIGKFVVVMVNVIGKVTVERTVEVVVEIPMEISHRRPVCVGGQIQYRLAPFT